MSYNTLFDAIAKGAIISIVYSTVLWIVERIHDQDEEIEEILSKLKDCKQKLSKLEDCKQKLSRLKDSKENHELK